MILRYRRDQCCNNVAHIAHERLITKLKNQSEFTQTAYLGGENAGGVATVDGVDRRGAFGSA